jgi:putative flavoprotein involved in K+ transport
MIESLLDVIVIGAGHAGLSISYYLKQGNLNHIVFEQAKIGDSWRNQRWDTFKLNSPNKTNLLPGQKKALFDDDSFSTATEFVSLLEDYSVKFRLPVNENCRVLSVEKVPGKKDFSVRVGSNGSERYYQSRQVVIASGSQNKKMIPSFAKNISPEIHQLHSCEYRNPTLLPVGNVLVVGSGQSGMQIAEDLIENGIKVFISTSRVPRVPRRYRGKDILEWLAITGFLDLRTADVTDPGILKIKQPQVSTTGLKGHTLSLQGLAKRGAFIVGKAGSAHDMSVNLEPNASMHVKFADEFSKNVKNMIDEYILKSNLDAPFPEVDIDDYPDEEALCASHITSIGLKENKITTIIWTTGFGGDFSYLRLPAFHPDGSLKHSDGVSDIEGLYFLGFPWLRKRKSGIIYGIREDAEFIFEKLLEYNKL